MSHPMRVLVLLCLMCGFAIAEPKAVALLPLDADQKLELYGQPVASELARTLKAAGIDVVVVGKKMATPDRAVLIVDGTITSKGDTITVSLRVRRRADGVVLDSDLVASGPMATLDKLATELAARLVPSVQGKLVEPKVDDPTKRPDPTNPTKPDPTKPDPTKPDPTKPDPQAPPAERKQMIVSVASSTGASATVEPLRAALASAVDRWIVSHDREPAHVDVRAMSPQQATKTVAHAQTELGIAFEVAGFEVTPALVPRARARIRVRVSGPLEIVFDRVVVTDTVVGDKGMKLDALAARTADEILQIMRPHMRRKITGWR